MKQVNVPGSPASNPSIRLPGELVHWPIDRLKPYERNPRTHSPEQITKIAASLLEFGWTNPILVDGEAGIIAGHGRLLAARELGMATVPVIELSHLTEAQKRAYVIADNRLALDAGWDEDLLAEELKALDGLDFDLALTGFDLDELHDLLEDEDAEEPVVPEPPEDPVSKPGDLWVMGNHRLLCGDSSDPAVVDRLLGGAPIHLVNTDPPYNVNVLDLFGGSGSTLLGAEQTGRRSFLMELDPAYCDVIVERWETATGKQAVLEEGGATFEAVAADRKAAGDA